MKVSMKYPCSHQARIFLAVLFEYKYSIYKTYWAFQYSHSNVFFHEQSACLTTLNRLENYYGYWLTLFFHSITGTVWTRKKVMGGSAGD